MSGCGVLPRFAVCVLLRRQILECRGSVKVTVDPWSRGERLSGHGCPGPEPVGWGSRKEWGWRAGRDSLND